MAINSCNNADIQFVYGIEANELICLLQQIDKDFKPQLTERLNLKDYAGKLISKAIIIAVKINESIAGVIAFYCNDIENRKAYITIMGVHESYRGKGLGSRLLEKAIRYIKNKQFKTIGVETWENSKAQGLYAKYGFITYAIEKDRPNNLNNIKMNLDLLKKGINSSMTKNITPFIELKNISNQLGINIYSKRDDLFPISGGGSKARKLEYILNEDVQQQYNAIVTAGSNQSNHLRSTALFAAKLGWKLVCVVHDSEPKIYDGNLKLLKLSGAELRFVKMAEVKGVMDNAMDNLRNLGYKPLYIWGGGHCVEGSLAYYDAVKELVDQLDGLSPDYIFVASGTGTTQAGIEIGVRQFLPGCKLIGISVAREKQGGKEAILESMRILNNYLGNPIKMPNNIEFDDNWIGGGYESTYPELLKTIKWAARTEGLILDPTYTGKAFHALKTYVENGIITPDAKIIFWHTGGLLNLMASKEI